MSPGATSPQRAPFIGIVLTASLSRRPTQDGGNTELIATKDAEIARLRDVIGRLERRGDLLDARLLSFRTAEAEYRDQVATIAQVVTLSAGRPRSHGFSLWPVLHGKTGSFPARAVPTQLSENTSLGNVYTQLLPYGFQIHWAQVATLRSARDDATQTITAEPAAKRARGAADNGSGDIGDPCVVAQSRWPSADGRSPAAEVRGQYLSAMLPGMPRRSCMPT